RHGETGFLYNPEDPDALGEVLRKARDLDAETHTSMRVNAYESANRMIWSPGRAVLFKVLAAW
ncbi:MAG: hypothetical protein AAGB28_18200, partial [Pseudomonadota bacterium]